MTTVCRAKIGSSVKLGRVRTRASNTAFKAMRSSVMWTVLMVNPGVRVGSVKAKDEGNTPFRNLKVLIAWRSSVICTAFTGVICKARGSSVNVNDVPEELAAVNVAVTVMSAFTVTVQGPVPLQPPPLKPPPLKPAKVESLAALACRVTEVLDVKLSEQSAPQLILVPVTIPLPDPALLMVRVNVGETCVPLTCLVAPPPPVNVTFAKKDEIDVELKRTVMVVLALASSE